jgi:ribonuclease P protein component
MRASKSFQNLALKVRVRFRSDQNTPRFGFIVPKKVMSKVVDRNLIKRRIKSILLRHVKKLKPADIIFYPQKEMVKKKFSEVEDEISQLFSKAILWK